MALLPHQRPEALDIQPAMSVHPHMLRKEFERMGYSIMSRLPKARRYDAWQHHNIVAWTSTV